MTVIAAIVGMLIFAAGVVCGWWVFNYALRLGLRVGSSVTHDEELDLEEEPETIEQETTA